MVVMRLLDFACPAVPAATAGGLAAALTGTPWSVRRARGPGSRPALEIWEAGNVADIIVATPIVTHALRGARRARCGGRMISLAWGRLPVAGNALGAGWRPAPVGRNALGAGPHPGPDGRDKLRIAFVSGWPARGVVPAGVIEVAGLAWFAIVAGRFAVATAAGGGGYERLRVRPARPAPAPPD
jgi:hypothetical protein